MIRGVLRGTTFLLTFFFIIGVIFSLYTYLLVDYSLENLEMSLSVTNQAPDSISQSKKNLYHNLMEDLAVNEMATEKADLKDLIFFELASRSFRELADGTSRSTARLYLNQLTQSKILHRGYFLKITDTIYRNLGRMLQLFFSIVNYVQRRLSPETKPFEVSSVILLTQAEEKERNWQLHEAAQLYRKYLKLYPKSLDKTYVTISLAYILIKMDKLSEAERLLHKIQVSYIGREEGIIATNLLKRVDLMRRHDTEIQRLLEEISLQKDSELGMNLQYLLGLEYLFTYRFALARQLFEQLVQQVSNETIRQKIKFYLGWINKLQARYDEATEIFLNLLAEEGLESKLALGLEAQLADIYYQQNDFQKALLYYQRLAKRARESGFVDKAVLAAWIAIAEVEQAKIYSIYLNDPVQGEAHLRLAGEAAKDAVDFGDIAQSFQQFPGRTLRDRAFIALRKRQIHLAWDLFRKSLRMDPNDAWTHSGLATVYVLFLDMPKALEYSEKGYRLKLDEYTAAVQGYVHHYLNKDVEAIGFYKESLSINSKYVASRYNITCNYLRIEDYQEPMKYLVPLHQEFKNVQNLLHSKFLNNMGYTTWMLGDHEKAESYFRESLQTTPQFRDARENLAYIHAPAVTNTGG